MSFIDVFEKDWNMLKKALKKEGIEIEIYINLIFIKLTDELTKIEEIKSIQNLIQIECFIENIIESY